MTRYWNVAPWAPSYVKMLKAAHKALKAADPKSETILAGLPNESWKALKALYDAGARGSFDVVALHPYTGLPKNVVRIVKIVRREMARRGDARVPVWLTELSWPAAKGKTVQHHDFETTDSGQAERLKVGLPLLAEERRALRIGRVYWYTWLSVEGFTDERLRLLGAAPDPRRADALRAGAGDVPAAGPPPAGLREAPGQRPALRLSRVRFAARAGRRRLRCGPGRAAGPPPAHRLAGGTFGVRDPAARLRLLRHVGDRLLRHRRGPGGFVRGHERARARARADRGSPRPLRAGRVRDRLLRRAERARARRDRGSPERRAGDPRRRRGARGPAARGVHACRLGTRAADGRAAPAAALRARLGGRGGSARRRPADRRRGRGARLPPGLTRRRGGRDARSGRWPLRAARWRAG